MTSAAVYEPEWASPPGHTIADVLRRKGLDEATFADMVGERQEVVAELLAGRQKITKEIARALAECLGASETFWLNRESQYRDDLTRHRLLVDDDLSEWLADIPVTELINLDWIPSVGPRDRLAAVLDFFGVDSIEGWRKTYRGLASAVSFRTSPIFGSHLGAVLSWLRRGEVLAKGQTKRALSVSMLEERLPKMRALTREKDPERFLPALRALCNEAGIALVVAPTPKRCRASGATWMAANGSAICILSHRYGTDDQFWFTFFHEMGHLVLHSERSLFLEDGDDVVGSDEVEANEFAARLLIPSQWAVQLQQVPKAHKDVVRLARAIGVSPGIVVGQMQHERLLPPQWLNKLKRSFKWQAG